MATAADPSRRPPEEDASRPIPPLRNGDRLTRDEFERRYDAMPGLRKAELIDGIVNIPSAEVATPLGAVPAMASPVSFRRHGRPHHWLNGLLWHYGGRTPGVEGADNASVRLDLDNMPQPDIALFVAPECGGSARIGPDDFIEGAPDLVAEVANSSVSNDLHAKLQVYRRNGVQEHLVWRVEDDAIDWSALRGGRFEPLPLDDGIGRSGAFPGLWIDLPALRARDVARLTAALDAGLASPEHAAFVARLADARTRLASAPEGDRT